MRARGLAAVAAVLFATGCASGGPMTAEITYTSEAEPVAPAAGGTCVYAHDARARTLVGGWSLPRDLLRPWLTDGLAARLGVPVIYVAQPPERGPYIALERVYIRHMATSMAGITVLRVHDGGVAEAYRGNETKVNWWGSDAEFSSLLSHSLDKAAVQIPAEPLYRTDCPAQSG